MIVLDAAVRIEALPSTRAVAHAAVRALLGELAAYPKPGLVSFVDNGSHADMNASHFVRSAAALRGYYARIARAGAQGAEFNTLRGLAVAAEVAMLRATGGVNTHRGAVFSVGLLAAAAGGAATLRASGLRAPPLGTLVRERWGAEIAAHRRDPASHGSAVTRNHGTGGAQCEAATGFPSVYGVALPAFNGVLAAGLPHRDAAVQAFFALLAHVEDTNLIHRGGAEGLRFAQRLAREFLDEGGVHGAEAGPRALAAHRAMVARALSPGGCADLLAACLFVASVEA